MTTATRRTVMSKVVHFEIPVDEPDRAQKFYAGVFGWDIQGWGDQPYWLVTAGAQEEPGADGALIARGEVHKAPVVVIGVEDLDAALQRVAATGARVVEDKQPVPGMGWAAYVEDTEGNVIGIWQSDESAA
jgi:uncharacterized protein